VILQISPLCCIPEMVASDAEKAVLNRCKFDRKGAMDALQFVRLRKALGKTQKEIAQLLGKSLKAIHSYEQDWRRVPPNVERMMLFLYARKRSSGGTQPKCWAKQDCPEDRKKKCPAWEYRCGEICWFISGSICAGKSHENWHEKLENCRACDVFRSIFQKLADDPSANILVEQPSKKAG